MGVRVRRVVWVTNIKLRRQYESRVTWVRAHYAGGSAIFAKGR